MLPSPSPPPHTAPCGSHTPCAFIQLPLGVFRFILTLAATQEQQSVASSHVGSPNQSTTSSASPRHMFNLYSIRKAQDWHILLDRCPGHKKSTTTAKIAAGQEPLLLNSSTNCNFSKVNCPKVSKSRKATNRVTGSSRQPKPLLQPAHATL
jgi:hypothetical protein